MRTGGKERLSVPAGIGYTFLCNFTVALIQSSTVDALKAVIKALVSISHFGVRT